MSRRRRDSDCVTTSNILPIEYFFCFSYAKVANGGVGPRMEQQKSKDDGEAGSGLKGRLSLPHLAHPATLSAVEAVHSHFLVFKTFLKLFRFT